jgi:FkbM family methyltransferase
MKIKLTSIIAFIFVIFIAQNTTAQTPLTNRQIYDFNPGDVVQGTHFYKLDPGPPSYETFSYLKRTASKNNDTLFYKITKVKAFRLETMLKETPIELFKIDAEGHGFEVLEGMGNEINNVKAIQIETEKDPNFEYQKLDSDVHQFLTNFGFELIDKTPCWTSQFDCLYINKNII